MPCDTITRMLIDVGKMDPDAVTRALEAEGIKVLSRDGKLFWTQNGNGHVFDPATGKVSASGRLLEESEITNLKQVCGKQIVREQSAKFGWRIKQIGPNKFEAVKRY